MNAEYAEHTDAAQFINSFIAFCPGMNAEYAEHTDAAQFINSFIAFCHKFS